MQDLRKANFVILQDARYVCELIGGKIYHSKNQAEAKRFFTFDEADDYWASKLNRSMDCLITELKA